MLSSKEYEGWVGRLWQGNKGLNEEARVILASHDQAQRDRIKGLEQLLRRLHDRIDALNNEMATVSRLCVLCRASGYDSEGIIHSLDCPLVLIRKCLKEVP